MSRYCITSDFNPFVKSRWKERAKKAEAERKQRKRRTRSQESR